MTQDPIAANNSIDRFMNCSLKKRIIRELQLEITVRIKMIFIKVSPEKRTFMNESSFQDYFSSETFSKYL